MSANTSSHSDYLSAFQQFLQVGDKSQLSAYLEGNRPSAFLSVYRNGFIRASVAALESNFPGLVTLWGEDYFAQVAAAYVNASPPASATLIGYGFERSLDNTTVSFIDFLQQTEEIIKQFPYVLDICRLEQAWSQALNENGDAFLTLEAVQALISQGVDLSELPLVLVDSSRMVHLEFDIFPLWGQLRFGELSEEQSIELVAQDNAVIFWQRDLQVQAKPLSAVEAVFMDKLKQSGSMDDASTEALALDENFDISTLFAELLNAHLLKQENET
ncbi:MAG: putative DNA-binding domain-containing protein [Leucothrix sp.]